MNVYPDASPIRLLVIGNDRVERLACRRVLERSGSMFSIGEAETMEQGLTIARAEDFDCILLDHRLPGFDGLDFLADFGEEGREFAPPVVVIAQSNDAGAAMRALKMGAADYVVKDSGGSLEWIPTAIFKVLRERRAYREKHQAMEDLRAAKAKYRGLVEQLPAIVYIASLEQPGKLLYLSPRLRDCLGHPVELCRDAPEGLLKWIHADDREHVAEQLARTYELHVPLRAEYRMIKHDGRTCWMLDEAEVVRDEEGRAMFLQGLLVDITEDKENERELEYYRHRLEDLVAQRTLQLEKQSGLLWAANNRMDLELCQRKQAEAALRASEARFRLLLESVGEGIFGMDREGRCTFVNKAALDLFGCGDIGEPEGQDILTALCRCRNGTEEEPAHKCPLLLTLHDGVPSRFTENLLRGDGSSFIAEFSAYPVRGDAGVTGAVVVARDLDETRQTLSRRLSRDSGYDLLTGLLNRWGFERRLEEAVAESRRDGSEHVLCYFDLDRFKLVNDAYGHAVGDQFLKSLASFLSGGLPRGHDVLARLGGDEFGLLLGRCPIDRAGAIANNFREAIRGFRFSWDGEEFSVGVSIGVVALNAATGSASAALSAADTACYVAKKRGRNRVQIAGVNEADRLGGLLAAREPAKGIDPARGIESFPRAASG